MSKQSDAKDSQGYVAKPIPRTCANCQNITQDFYHYGSSCGEISGKNPDTSKYARPTYSRNLRCGIGKFAVKKTATCLNFKLCV